MLKRFVNACDAIAEWSGRILSIGEYVIMIVMLWQVSARYIFKIRRSGQAISVCTFSARWAFCPALIF